VVVLTLSSQESQDDTETDELPFVRSNEIVFNVEPNLGSIADVVDDVGMIPGVHPQPITAVVPTGHVPFIVLEFMAQDDATFGDEQAKDSANDCLVPEMGNWDKVLL
jgi:hypothetical protein